MKKIIAAIVFLPSTIFSQENRNQLTLLGGYEFKDVKTMAWNVQTHFNRQFLKSDRWSSEYGAGLYVLEHRRDFDLPVLHDSALVYPTYGATIYPGYWQSDYIYYSRTIGLRLQAGVNYTFLKKEKWSLSVGLNVVNDISLNHKEHGLRTLQPVAGYGDTLPYTEYHYSDREEIYMIHHPITIQLQPHLDCFVPVNEQLLFTARLGYYGQLLPGFVFVRPQLNLGIAYRW